MSHLAHIVSIYTEIVSISRWEKRGNFGGLWGKKWEMGGESGRKGEKMGTKSAGIGAGGRTPKTENSPVSFRKQTSSGMKYQNVLSSNADRL